MTNHNDAIDRALELLIAAATAERGDDKRIARTILTDLAAEIERPWVHWVNDLQSGMYINCVYCGHRYGPKDEVPVSMADTLKEHVEKCPEHPMSRLKARLAAVEALRCEWSNTPGYHYYARVLGDALARGKGGSDE